MAGYRHKLLWANDGRQVITGLVQTTKTYFENNPLSKNTNGFVTTPAAKMWHRIPLEGADTLAIEYRSQIIDKGGLGAGAITAATMRIMVIGMGDDRIVPGIIAGTPAAAVGTQEHISMTLAARPRDQRVSRTIYPADSVALISTMGIFGLTTPVDGLTSGWAIEIGKRQFDAGEPYVAGTGNPLGTIFPHEYSVTGLGVVYVSIGVVNTYNAGDTFATTKMRGTVTAILGYMGGSARFQREIQDR